MNNVSNINEASNSVKSMPLIAHSGAPVITTDMLADVYGTEVINIQVNHSRNKNRFIEGKHFYKLTGSILKEFKNWLTKSKLVYKGSKVISKHAKSIILWTERGAARHAKMLDTDNAWDVFEALEDFYFAKKEDAFHKTTTDDRAPLRNAVDCLMTKRRLSFPKAYGYVHAKYGVNSIDELPIELLPEAVDYIYKTALEGEYIPRQEPLPLNPINTHILMTNINGAMTHIRAIKDYWNDGLKESLKKLGYDKTGSITEHMIDSLFNLTSASFELTNTDKAKRIK